MQFPNDENGAVFRRMVAAGFPFDQTHDVDFYATFATTRNADIVAKLVSARDPSEKLTRSMSKDSDQGNEIELKITKHMLVSYESVTAFETLFADLCEKYDGVLGGWGVLQEKVGDDTADDQSRPQSTKPRRLSSQLNNDQPDEAEQNFVDGIKQYGWMHTNAPDEDDKPGFSFTTGFAATIGHPELIVFTVDKKVAHDVFGVLYRCAQNGKPVPRGKRTRGIFPGDEGYVFAVAKRQYANYLGWSRWFYKGDDFECLQIVWPDEAGVFPWETGFDVQYADTQIDLTEHGWAAEVYD